MGCKCSLGGNEDNDLSSVQPPAKESQKSRRLTTKEVSKENKVESTKAVDFSQIREELLKSVTFYNNNNTESEKNVTTLATNVRDMSKFRMGSNNNTKKEDIPNKTISVKNIIIPEYKISKSNNKMTSFEDDDSYENIESYLVDNTYEISKTNLTSIKSKCFILIITN